MPVSKRTAEQRANQSAAAPAPLKPYWQSPCGRAVVYVGDCLDVMSRMEPNQFHAVVTDPPYGLEFMGKAWDAPWKVDASHRRADEMHDPIKAKYLRHNIEYVRDSQKYEEWFATRAEGMLRVTKPGAHLLSFGGTRMWFLMAHAIDRVGWEVKDTIAWVYLNGFPKGLDVSKSIDKLLGAERKTIAPGTAAPSQGQFNARNAGASAYGYGAEYDVTTPSTDEAKQWDGWNTSLKPAFEPVILARRPPCGSVARNTLDNGCGGINIGACRVGTTGSTVVRQIQSYSCSGSGVYQFNAGEAGSPSMNGGYVEERSDGRHPANLIHDGSEEIVCSLPDGASRIFYSPKADSGDRPHGKGKGVTTHPTVKPLDLMRYLVRLVCAPGGTVLDPFMGSGSTGCAAILEGMRFAGIEQSREYADIAVGRLKLALAEKRAEDVPDAPGRTSRADRSAPLPPERMRGT